MKHDWNIYETWLKYLKNDLKFMYFRRYRIGYCRYKSGRTSRRHSVLTRCYMTITSTGYRTYCVITGELWNIFCGYFEEKTLCRKEVLLPLDCTKLFGKLELILAYIQQEIITKNFQLPCLYRLLSNSANVIADRHWGRHQRLIYGVPAQNSYYY